MPRIAFAVELQTGPAASVNERIDEQYAAIYRHRPEVYEAYIAFREAWHRTSTISPRLAELLRLRIAFHNQCRSCMALRNAPDVVPEGLVCSLEQPEEAENLTEAEKAALHFADLFATDHLAIDESVYDGLREHFDEGQLVELGIACASMVGTGRMVATWAIVDGGPEDADGLAVPWRSPVT